MAKYYQEILINYDKIIKYCLMGIERNDFDAMYRLATFYENMMNVPMAIKYFEMCIEFGDINSIHDLAYFYEYATDNTIKSTELYLNYILKQRQDMKNFSLYINDCHVENLMKLVGNVSFTNIILTCNSIREIDIEIKMQFLNAVFAAYSQALGSRHIINAINTINNYDFLVKNKSFLNFENATKIMMVDALESVNVDCDVCASSSNCVTLKCNSSHIICKNCVLSLKQCPYCRMAIM
jgi:hypothetical protein